MSRAAEVTVTEEVLVVFCLDLGCDLVRMALVGGVNADGGIVGRIGGELDGVDGGGIAADTVCVFKPIFEGGGPCDGVCEGDLHAGDELALVFMAVFAGLAVVAFAAGGKGGSGKGEGKSEGFKDGMSHLVSEF